MGISTRQAWRNAHPQLQEAADELIRRAQWYAPTIRAHRPKVQSGLGTFAVNAAWDLLYDPAVFDRWTPEQIIGVLWHELQHSLRGHCTRAKESAAEIGVTPKEWNVAADGEINDDCEYDLPAGHILPPRGMDGATVEEIAEAIKNGAKPRATRPEPTEQDEDGEAGDSGVEAEPVDEDGEPLDEDGDDAEGEPGEDAEGEDDGDGAEGTGTEDDDDEDGEADGSGDGDGEADEDADEDGEGNGDAEGDAEQDGDDGDAEGEGQGGNGQPGSGSDGEDDGDEVEVEDAPDCWVDGPEPDKDRQAEIDRARRATADGIMDDPNSSDDEYEWAEQDSASRGEGDGDGEPGDGDGVVTVPEDTEEQWERHLRVTLQGVSGFGAADYNTRVPDPNFPDYLVPTLDSPVSRVALIIDTSGSMTAMLPKAAGHAVKVLKALGEADVTLYPWAEKQTAPIVRGLRSMQDVVLGQGGGTALDGAIEQAIKDGTDMVVVITDTFTPWPENEPSVPVVVGAVPTGGQSWRVVIEQYRENYNNPAYRDHPSYRWVFWPEWVESHIVDLSGIEGGGQ